MKPLQMTQQELFSTPIWRVETSDIKHQSGVVPAEGQFVIFPSYLLHRPAPCPSADKWRITVAMGCFVHWHKRYSHPVSDVGPKEWDEALKQSFNPSRSPKNGLG